MTPLDLALAGGAGFVAGAVNALAGGGTLLSFPVLIAIGLPPVSANVTNTVALSPGYLGGVLSQREQLRPQRSRVPRLAVAAALGGLTGSVLLLVTSDSVFRNLIPVLLLAATLLLAGQDRLRARLRIGERVDGSGAVGDPRWLPLPVFVVSIYGGYFGAGLGIMLLAVLGTVLHDDLKRLNALKQVLAFAINATAAAFFLTSDRVAWAAAGVMAVASLAGGGAGGRLAGKVRPLALRRIVVAVGVSVSVAYALKTWT